MKMTPEKRGLMSLLANEILPKVKPKRFNMGVWWASTCGCAIGWGCRNKWFKKQGLVIQSSEPFIQSEDGEFYGIEAVMRFFEISESDALNLFGSHNLERTPAQESEVLNEYLRTH